MDDLRRDGLPSLDEPTPVDCMRSCAHLFACKRIGRMAYDVDHMDDSELAEALRCATCEEWED